MQGCNSLFCKSFSFQNSFTTLPKRPPNSFANFLIGPKSPPTSLAHPQMAPKSLPNSPQIVSHTPNSGSVDLCTAFSKNKRGTPQFGDICGGYLGVVWGTFWGQNRPKYNQKQFQSSHVLLPTYKLSKTIFPARIFNIFGPNFWPPDPRRCPRGAFRHTESESKLETDQIQQPELKKHSKARNPKTDFNNLYVGTYG